MVDYTDSAAHYWPGKSIPTTPYHTAFSTAPFTDGGPTAFPRVPIPDSPPADDAAYPPGYDPAFGGGGFQQGAGAVGYALFNIVGTGHPMTFTAKAPQGGVAVFLLHSGNGTYGVQQFAYDNAGGPTESATTSATATLTATLPEGDTYWIIVSGQWGRGGNQGRFRGQTAADTHYSFADYYSSFELSVNHVDPVNDGALQTPATHLFPGYDIENNHTYHFNNTGFQNITETYPYFNAYYGGGTAVFGFYGLGETHLIDIEAVGDGTQGVTIGVYRNSYTVVNGVEQDNWVLATATSAPPGVYAIQRNGYHLGERYIVTIGSAGGDSSKPSGHEFDQNFTLKLSDTSPYPFNDLRSMAYDVTIPSDGAIYVSPGVNYQGYNSDYSGSDDFIYVYGGDRLEWTAWWKYEPSKTTDLSVSWAVTPLDPAIWGIRCFRETVDGAIIRLPGYNSTNTFTISNVLVGEKIWFTIGCLDTVQTHSQYYQRYHISVTGAKSVAQIGDEGGGGDTGGGSGPPNDFRADAIAVPITSTVRLKTMPEVDLNHATTDPPDNYGDPAGLHFTQTVWYKWKSDTAGYATINTSTTSSTPHTGCKTQILDQTNNDNLLRVAIIGESVQFKVVKGHTYYFCIGIAAGEPHIDMAVVFTLKAPDLPGPKKPVKAIPAASSTVLELIRQFQAESGYAVRIIDDKTIEVVDPDEPIPDDFTNADAEEYYSRAKTELAASSTVLRLSKGDLDTTGEADILHNDIGIILSGWDMPQRMPFPDSTPPRVNKVTMEFTRDSFDCNLGLSFKDIPISTRSDD